MVISSLLLEAFRKASKSEVVLLRNITSPPTINDDFVSPHLVVCINNKGTARLEYDMREFLFRENDVFCIMPNHVVRFLERSDDYCVSLLVISALMAQELPYHLFSHDYHKFHVAPHCSLSKVQMSRAGSIVDCFATILRHPSSELPHRHEILMSMISICYELLNMCRREQDKSLAQQSKDVELFNHFSTLVVENYRTHKEVGFYAKSLDFTPKYFSKRIQDIAGMSASDWIEHYTATMGKHLIITQPKMSMREVAHRLGFSELASFCRFFKRLTGMTPKHFRTSSLNEVISEV